MQSGVGLSKVKTANSTLSISKVLRTVCAYRNATRPEPGTGGLACVACGLLFLRHSF